MISSHLISVFLVLAFVASTTTAFPTFSNTNTTSIKVIRIDEGVKLDDFLKAADLHPLSRSGNIKIPIRYTFGSRNNSSDRLVSQGSGWKSYSTLQNFQLHFDYPSSGKGALITYVEIDVEQSSKEGRAYVSAGGIKDRNISIMVEANNTYLLKYSFKVYGIY